MELIFAFAKLLEYLFVVPLLWVAGLLAGFFYPLEGDSRQDFLIWVFATLIVIILGFASYYWLVSPDKAVPETAQQNAEDVQRLQDLKAALKSLAPLLPNSPYQ